MKLCNFKSLFTLALALSMCAGYGQTQKQKTEITKDYNVEELESLRRSFMSKSSLAKKEAIALAKLNNWPVTATLEDGRFVEIQRVDASGNPIYYSTFNVDAARSTRTNHLNSGGSLGLNLNGQNMTAYVWDGGIARSSHQEYDGAGGTNRFSVGDGSSSPNFHAAHVTGTIIASGVQASAKGMAPYARAIGSDWNSDLSEATYAASNGMLLSNHSYGFRSDLVPDWYFGAYISDSRDWDNLMYNTPNYLMVVAAGNDGNSNYNATPINGNAAYDKLTGHATSKNNIVVANANDANIDSNGNLVSVFINSSSSEGPTDDLRIKPDITGNGTGVYSTYASSNTAYASISGTSMASPNVCGSLLLLQQHYNNTNNSFMKAATLKGLALHTADDTGNTGPDAVYGWGLLNAKSAAEAISQNGNQSIIQELTLNAGGSYTTTVTSDGLEPLLASISWTDPAGIANTGTTNLTTPVLVNDLDIRITKNSTTFTPWRLTGVTTNGLGDNSVDPYERIDVLNASGTYTITVTHKGSLSSGSQNFSLIITGITNQASECIASVPTGVSSSSITSSSAVISWNTVPDASYNLRYRASGTSSWATSAVSATTLSLTGLSADTSYEVQVRSTCANGSTSNYSASLIFTTAESGGGVNCATVVSSFPYNEGFENSIGQWTQNSDDDFDWTTKSGGTLSRNTGPSSANQGSYYVYMESSAPNYATKTAILTSPCFDISSLSSPSLAFSYHMYGASNMGNLRLEVSTDGSNWTSIWSKAGNQGNSWQTASVDLSSLGSSSTLQLRFNGTTGTTWRGDMAIDNLSITGVVSSDCTNIQLSLKFDNYPEETSWEIRDASGTTVYAGGTYGDQADGTTLNLADCIPNACYTLVVRDSYGDGMCCAYGNGSYTLTNTDTNEVLASGGSFGSSDSTNFCLGNSSNNLNTTLAPTTKEGTFLEVYPNPVIDYININTNIDNTFTYELINLQGRTVKKGALRGDRINLFDIHSGMYILKLNSSKKQLTRKIHIQ